MIPHCLAAAGVASSFVPKSAGGDGKLKLSARSSTFRFRPGLNGAAGLMTQAMEHTGSEINPFTAIISHSDEENRAKSAQGDHHDINASRLNRFLFSLDAIAVARN
ncbi:MAG TPA: hypothetical protein VIJ38_03235 [Acidobacteriaceae bacterium]